MVVLLIFINAIPVSASSVRLTTANPSCTAQLNHLYELWSYYKYAYIKDGRVISLDENHITTSEGQGYALLRAVWANDHQAFKRIYQWTLAHLQREQDPLFAWKYKQDRNTASDADCDIALALVLAAEKFSVPRYKEEALPIIHAIWEKTVIQVNQRYYLTAGNWAPGEAFPTLHVAYFAPYAYDIFADIDTQHPWRELIRSSYEIWDWLYFKQKCKVPPEVIYLNKQSGRVLLNKPGDKRQPRFSYDAFPLFWRVAVDEVWFGRGHTRLRRAMLAFFRKEWQTREKIFDTYTLSGRPLSTNEGLPLYATLHSLALIDDPQLAEGLAHKTQLLWQHAVAGQETPYYLHNWLWLARALDIQVARNYTAFFDFLRPFDFRGFSAHFPWRLFAITLLLYGLLVWTEFKYDSVVKGAFLMCGFAICLRYLWWRIQYSLNFMEALGPFISISLLTAECYCLSTVVLLLLQVGLDAKNKRKAASTGGTDNDFSPWVDIYIPIYSESLTILEKTLMAASALDYPHKKVFVLDDSHREAVQHLAESYQATYIRGPRKHAKAGNLNHALPQTRGELIAVFDTDHIPVSSFLKQTVPYFNKKRVGVVQTPHHFYNQDVFQRAFLCSPRVPNEQDMFNHGIQGGRDNWQGSFFVGSGALFRRTALEKIGGFKLMSITEDIHSSQHLHAQGFSSVFVDKDLAVGLTAESLSAHILQRKRWMQGCLQIFFKNNPLFQKGLGFKLRWGYFASLYYFFFPITRVVFWITPLYYLLFHLHPLFADVSTLLAYMLPYLICLPLLSASLLKRWPRMLWGVIYENAISFPLFFSLFGLLLPGKLGFKVTPKGLVTNKRRFDWGSSAVTLFMTAVTIAAILKGLLEFYYFEIEKDAYFFNLAWAVYNLLFMLVSLLVAWERPQKRTEERLARPIAFTLKNGHHFHLSGRLKDISQSGVSFILDQPLHLPEDGTLTLFDQNPITLPVKCVYYDKKRLGRMRCAFRFIGVTPHIQQTLLLRTLASPQTWENAHKGQTRSNLMMIYFFLKGVACCFKPLMPMKRLSVRQGTFQKTTVWMNGREVPAILSDQSEYGFQLILWAKGMKNSAKWHLTDSDGQWVPIKNIYLKKRLPFIYQAGFSRFANR